MGEYRQKEEELQKYTITLEYNNWYDMPLVTEKRILHNNNNPLSIINISILLRMLTSHLHNGPSKYLG